MNGHLTRINLGSRIFLRIASSIVLGYDHKISEHVIHAWYGNTMNSAHGRALS